VYTFFNPIDLQTLPDRVRRMLNCWLLTLFLLS